MRKITIAVVGAFNDGRKMAKGNTHTDGTTLYLFDNAIAQHRLDGLYITDAGWSTVTTRERLNGIIGVNVGVRKGVQSLNNIPWTGEWIKVI